jgi:hypothetical protein
VASKQGLESPEVQYSRHRPKLHPSNDLCSERNKDELVMPTMTGMHLKDTMLKEEAGFKGYLLSGFLYVALWKRQNY